MNTVRSRSADASNPKKRNKRSSDKPTQSLDKLREALGDIHKRKVVQHFVCDLRGNAMSLNLRSHPHHPFQLMKNVINWANLCEKLIEHVTVGLRRSWMPGIEMDVRVRIQRTNLP